MMDNALRCHGCCVGTLSRETYTVGGAEQQKLVCDHCGIEVYDEECARFNVSSLVVAKKDGWIRVGERLPDRADTVPVWIDFGRGDGSGYLEAAYYWYTEHGDGKVWQDECGLIVPPPYQVTHWIDVRKPDDFKPAEARQED
jgi:hypothetical protein